MANHSLAVGVYSQYKWQTYVKSLEDSESVEKVTSSFLRPEENINDKPPKSYFGETFDCLPGVR